MFAIDACFLELNIDILKWNLWLIIRIILRRTCLWWIYWSDELTYYITAIIILSYLMNAELSQTSLFVKIVVRPLLNILAPSVNGRIRYRFIYFHHITILAFRNFQLDLFVSSSIADSCSWVFFASMFVLLCVRLLT